MESCSDLGLCIYLGSETSRTATFVFVIFVRRLDCGNIKHKDYRWLWASVRGCVPNQ